MRTFRRRTGSSFHDHLDVDPSLISDDDVVSADTHAPKQVSTGEGQYEASCWLAQVANKVEVLQRGLGYRNWELIIDLKFADTPMAFSRVLRPVAIARMAFPSQVEHLHSSHCIRLTDVHGTNRRTELIASTHLVVDAPSKFLFPATHCGFWTASHNQRFNTCLRCVTLQNSGPIYMDMLAML